WPLPALIHWEVKVGGRSMKDVGGAVLAGSSPPFLGRERAAVDVDVGPERRSPRYHETCLALESVKEGSAAVSEPRCVWLRVHIVKDLEKARRLPVRVEELVRAASAQEWSWATRIGPQLGRSPLFLP
ncbi:MAG: hypothetical protein ACPIOQ_33035, partial [Promethearchaeia archaeon]